MKTQFVFLALALVSSSALAGGYPGNPVPNGMLPVELDHPVSLDRLTRTLRACEKAVAADLARQLSRLPVDSFQKEFPPKGFGNLRDVPWNFDESGVIDKATYNGGGNWYFGTDASTISVDFFVLTHFEARHEVVVGAGAPHSVVEFENGYGSLGNLHLMKDGRWIGLTGVDLPYVTFGNSLKNAKYDEYGDIDPSSIALESIVIKVPESYADQVVLKNVGTGLPTSLHFNERAYVDCFFDEIAK